jgi:hypothetical protein
VFTYAYKSHGRFGVGMYSTADRLKHHACMLLACAWQERQMRFAEIYFLEMETDKHGVAAQKANRGLVSSTERYLAELYEMGPYPPSHRGEDKKRRNKNSHGMAWNLMDC